MTSTQAIALAATRWWIGRPAKEIAQLQMNEPMLCMDFDAFQDAVSEHLGQPVFTHQLTEPRIHAAINGDDPIPTFDLLLAEHNL